MTISQTLERPETLEKAPTVQTQLAKARHAAAIGDGPHTTLFAQEAVCLAIASLATEISALRKELSGKLQRT